MLISAYFDESSEENSKDGLLAVCGYALDDKGVTRIIPPWKKMLRKYGLPYFHMAECNSCTGIFDHVGDEQCDRCARRAIKLARKYTLHGHAFVLDQSEYRRILQDRGFACDPYTFMVWGAYIHVHRWIHQNRPDHRISLFFESGYKTQDRADELLKAISQDDWGGKNRYTSHSFVKKEDCEPAQAADLLAWHVRKGFENKKNRKPIRKDTNALIEDKRILTIEWTAPQLERLRVDFCKTSGSLENAAKTIFSKGGAAIVGAS